MHHLASDALHRSRAVLASKRAISFILTAAREKRRSALRRRSQMIADCRLRFIKVDRSIISWIKSDIVNMDEDFFRQNKHIEERFECLIHTINERIDKLHFQIDCSRTNAGFHANKNKPKDPYSNKSLMTFRAPYIRDFRDFCSPMNEDIKHIQQLPTGMGNVEPPSWSREAKQQLREAVIEHYSRSHLIELIRQKNQMLDSPEDVAQKVRLIDEQAEQVKAKNEPRIFVPEDRHDTQIDWCAISAKLSSYKHEAKDCRLMWSNMLHWTINENDWTKDEDICLIDAVAKHGKNDWDLIAAELNTGRMAWQCCARYHQEYASVQSTFQPGSDETEKIIEVINLCRIGNFVPWNQVMYFIKYHDLHQVKHQWQRYIDQQQGGRESNTRAWSDREDLLLLKAVAKYGEKDWSRVADCIPGRTNKSCRERYIMRARFAKRAVGSWRRHEDCKLLSLVQEYGPNWSTLIGHFTDRNSHQLRNRFELLKSQDVSKRKGPIKHRKLYRSLTDESVDYVKYAKRQKPSHEREVDKKLHEIFSTYQSINMTVGPRRSLTYRSSQDEQIYQCLVETLCDIFLGKNLSEDRSSNLSIIMRKAVESCASTSASVRNDRSHSQEYSPKSCILAPSKPTIQAYKAWSLQQDYLSQFQHDDEGDVALEDIDDRIVRIVIGIFLLPAILSKIKVPEVVASSFQIGSVIDKQSKNLYKIRSLQSNLLKR